MNLNPPKISQTSISLKKTSHLGLIEVISLLVFCGIFINYALLPKYEEHKLKKTDLATVKGDLNDLEKTQKTIETLYAAMQETQAKENIKLLDEGVPLDARLTKSYMLLESLVKSSGMAMGGLTVEPLSYLKSAGVENNQNWYDVERTKLTQTISLNMTGSMDQFMGFLRIIENNPRLFDVVNLEISGTEKGSLGFKIAMNSFAFDK